MDRLTESVVTIAVAIIGLATLAVLVSRNANTSGVISAAGNAFSKSLGVAISPVSGGGSSFGNPNGGFL
jgi:hypothetical protein